MFECFHCGKRAVIWQSDFEFEDYGFDGNGIVQVCRCTNCNADIWYLIDLNEEENNDAEDDM